MQPIAQPGGDPQSVRAGSQAAGADETRAVLEAIAHLETLGATVCVRGGWAVDALVGEQTRPHHDVDLDVTTHDLVGLGRRLTEAGWTLVDEPEPGRLILSTPDAVTVDLHAVSGPPYRPTEVPSVTLGGQPLPVRSAQAELAERAHQPLSESARHDLLQLARVLPTGGSPTLHEGEVELRGVPSGRADVALFAGEVAGRRVGAGVVTVHGDEGRLDVYVEPAHRRSGVGTALARGLVRYAFDTLGLRRLEARHPLGDFPAERLGVRAGFRREGVARAAAAPGRRTDMAVLARLPSDVDPTRDTLVAHLSTVSPARLAASLLVRDTAGNVLLVEPTYKARWDLPGGSVEAGESPRAAAGREGHEELGVDVVPGQLLAVDWLGGPAGHGDGLFFLFDGGVVTPQPFLAAVRLPADELRSARFVAPADAASMLNPRLAGRLTRALEMVGTGRTRYLENGLAPATSGGPPTGDRPTGDRPTGDRPTGDRPPAVRTGR